MKPLLLAVVAICLVISSNAHPENIEDVKGLPQSNEPVVEAEESEPQARKERCATCTGTVKLSLKRPNDVLAALQALPGAEVHTQQSFESCSSDKGCAGLKVKDGRVVERFGNVDSFKAAAAADGGNEFQFHAGGALGNVFEGGNQPFWWMNQNSPFKNAAGAGGNFEKFSKSSSSFTSSGNAGGAGAGGAFLGGGGGVDIAANPFLNGDFSKLAGGFGAGAEGGKPAGFQSSSFESSSFSSSSKDVDISKNPFLNGDVKLGQGGFGAQAGFGAGSSQFGAGSGAGQAGSQGAGSFGSSQSAFSSQSNFGAQSGQGQFGQGGSGQGAQGNFGSQSGQFAGSSNTGFNKFGASGYTGSSPSPFTASTAGSNVNLIQNSQKANEFDYEQQQQTQQNIDEAFQSTGNVHAHEHSGGELQQTCAGQGYVCVHKAQCNNGVVNTNGAGVLQAKTQKQYCNIKTEICCRIEVSSLSGAGGLQGSLGVGSATFQGSGSQGSGLFVSGQSSQAGQSSQSGQSAFGAGQGTGNFGANSGSFGNGQSSFGSNAFGASSSSSFGNRGTQNTFGQGTQSGSAFGQGSQSGNQGSGFESSSTGSGFSATGSFGSSAGSNTGLNRGTGASGFESGFNTNKFNSQGSSSSFGSGTGFSTAAPTTNRFGANNFNNEVYKSTSQSNFIETDSFSAGSEANGIFRPGASGSGLKPGIPYLPPVDSSNQPTIISSTAVPVPTFTTPRPFTTVRPTIKPTYLPPVTSTSAPGYLPPEQSDSSNQRETRIPGPNYVDGGIILDESRLPKRPTVIPAPSEIPSGCAAALKCTPIEFCTAEGVISNTTVILTRDQEAYRVPLTDCKDLESGRIGKCCRDPLYTDPWPTNQLGKWVPGVFGGNDGKYVADSRVAGNNPRPSVSTLRPPVTGNVLLNNFRSPKPTVPAYGPNQITPGYPSTTASSISSQKGQFEIRGQGQFSQGGQGQFSQGGQGQFTQGGQGQFSQGGQSQFAQGSQGQFSQGGQGQFTKGGQGQFTKGGQGQFSQGGQGQFGAAGQGSQLAQGSQFSSNTQSFVSGQRGQGSIASQGQGQRGQGQIVSQGQGQFTEQGQGSFSSGGRGQYATGGQGQIEIQGQAGQGQFTQISGESQKTFGQGIIQGGGQAVSEGQGVGVNRGQGTLVSQGGGGIASQGQGGFAGQSQSSFASQSGFASQQGQGGFGSQGQGGFGSQGQGAFGSQSQSGFGAQSQGSLASQGQGGLASQGQGGFTSQGQGAFGSQSQGAFGSQGQGSLSSQGQGFGISAGFGTGVRQGFGQGVLQGQGQGFGIGFGSGIRQGFGQAIVQGEGQTSASEDVYRVFLGQYSGSGGQCGVLNGQKPYGNRNDLEVDFAEIPWQAMVLLQTNRSLLCGGVITRPDVVVTSASCVEGLEAKNVLIKGGEWKLGQDDEPLPFQIVQVKTILRHPFYKSGSLKNDAAVLVLSENLRLAKNIQPICLPRASETLDAFYNGAGECIVTGWGKIVLQAHLQGAIMHSLNVSLINPGECQAKLSSDYPHLLEQYDQDSCACGQPLNPVNNMCKVDIGSALACTTDNEHYVLRGLYSWDSGCQTGNQLAAFYKFDLEWYEWCIGLTESVRFAKYNVGSKVTQNKFSSQINAVKGNQYTTVKGGSSQYSAVKGGSGASSLTGGSLSGGSLSGGSLSAGSLSGGSLSGGSGSQYTAVKGGSSQYTAVKGGSGASSLTGGSLSGGSLSGESLSGGLLSGGVKGFNGQGQFGFSQFGTSSKFAEATQGGNFGAALKLPISNSFSTSYSEKKVFQTEPKIITYTTKPEIVTFTTKPEYFTFTTKPKIVTYTTKPQIITYETSGSGTNPQYVSPGVTFNPDFTDITSLHKHNDQCKCLEKGKK